jgi:acyl carrier protein
MGTLVDAVRDFVNRRCLEIGVDASTVDSKFNLWEGGLLDSISIVDLVVVIERFTGKTIDLEDLEIETFYSIEAIAEAFETRPV